MNQEPVKICFAFHSYLLDKWTVETVWAYTIEGQPDLYRIDSIPFYATSVASRDIVRAPYDTDQKLPVFQEVIKASGHSTVQVVMMDKTISADNIRNQFAAAGCESEKFNDGYFVLDIPATAEYARIRSMLRDLQQREIIDYAEACLSSVHFYT